MNFRYLRCLAGPSRWARCPVFEAAIDFSKEMSWSAQQIRNTVERLDAESNIGQPEQIGQRVDLKSVSGIPMDLATAYVQNALRIHNRVAGRISFGAVKQSSSPNLFFAAVQYVTEELGQAVMEAALTMLETASTEKPLQLDDLLKRLLELSCEQFPLTNYRNLAGTFHIFHAARKRNIPAAQLFLPYIGCLRLGQGSKHHRLRASEPDTVSSVARELSTDKPLCKQLLQEAGVPVPMGCVVETVEQAWASAQGLGLPVAIKPVDTDVGIGVSLDIRCREQLEQAFNEAVKHASKVLVEQFAPGVEHRVLVVGDRVSAVTRIEPPQVVGDGVSTIAALVERVNMDPRRGEEGSTCPWFKLKLDDVALSVLASEGLTVESIPSIGQRVLVRRNPPYIKHGGVPVDVTDSIHPLTASQAVAAAKFMQIDVAGLDVVAVDIDRPLEEQEGVFVEINTSPGLWLHLPPYIESPRSVGKDIVDMLFAPWEDGRIPVVAVVSETSNLATNHLVRLLAQSGVRAASACEKEIVVAGRSYVPQGNSPQSRAAALFQNETVDTAILKTTPQELFHAGLGNDQCDVALVIDSLKSARNARESSIIASNSRLGVTSLSVENRESQIDESHILGECMQALCNALSPNGILVLEAEQHDPVFSPDLPVERIIRFAVNERIAGLEEHLLAGGTGVYVQDARIVLSQGNQPSIPLGCLPARISVQELRWLLASLGAAMGLGQRIESLREYVDSLGNPQHGICRVDTFVPALSSQSCSSPRRAEPIISAACSRNIPATVLTSADRRFLRLGQGSKQHRCQGMEPDTVSAVAQMASSDKQMCKYLLTEAGVPVPLGRVVNSTEQAWSAACDLGLPVAIKPVDGGSGSGVSLDLRTREQVETAFYKAELVDNDVLVEKFVSGLVFRVTVAGNRVLAVSLVNRLTLPHMDTSDTGDSLADLSRVIHPDTSAQAIAAVHAVRLPVADVEVIALDISKRLEEQGGVVVGVSCNRLLNWGNPCGPAEQDTLAEEIVTSLYPHPNGGRIPVVAILDDTSGYASKHLTAMLARAGLCAGTAGDSEIAIAERHWTPADNSPSERARVVFQAPIVDVALLKISRSELICLGIGNDLCNVAIVLDSVSLDIGSVASEMGILSTAFPEPEVDGLGSIEKLLQADILGAGILVLPLDLRLSRVEQSISANRIIWFAASEDIVPSVVRLVEGERAVIVEAEYFVLVEGFATRVQLGKRPTNLRNDELAPMLASLAAALALGLEIEILKEYWNLQCLASSLSRTS